MRDWKGYTVLHSMSKQSEGMRPSGRNSPFAGRVWAIAEAERGGWENVPITCPTNTPEDLFFLFATTIQISNRELTRALRNLVVSLRGNPTLLNKSLSSSKLASSRRPHRKLTPSFSKKCLSTVEIFGHGRSRRARCASAPELTPSSWPQYATSVASAASGGFEVLALFSMFSSANADSSLPRCTARASSPVAENAGAPFRGPSSATRYLESLFGTTRQPRSSDPRRASRFFAPGRPPVQQGARGDATRAAARNMSPRVRKCASWMSRRQFWPAVCFRNRFRIRFCLGD